MGKKKQKVLYDADGARRVMRKTDYMADMGGQLALGVMANLVGQLTYFYTDKVGMAVGGVGIAMMIAKIIDALTDVLVGNMIDHSKGGNKKYYSWMLKMAIPAAVIIIMMFTVPIQAGQTAALIYVLVTNLLLTAVIYTMIATPFSAVMIVRTHSQSERSNMGLFRAVGNYGAGTIIAIITIPVTNMLGGTQSAWIKYGVALALGVLLLFLICYNNGRKAKFASDYESESENASETAEIVKIAHAVGASVEAELGHIFTSKVVQGEGAGTDSTDDYEDLDNIYTDPEVAKKFVEMTNVDCLAVAFGTTHGVYLTEPKLDLSRVARLREATNISLVMHGGSGVSDEDYAVAIENGICKVNYYTYMNTAGGKASKEYWADDSKPLFYDSMSLVATEAIKEDVKRAIKVFQKIK